MKDQRKFTGAVATSVQAHVFDASGRIAEGISATANFDGVSNYEEAGLFFSTAVWEDTVRDFLGSRRTATRQERGVAIVRTTH
jgi:hypothetical protein